MTTSTEITRDIATAVRRWLLELAKAEEDRAATEAAAVPYWSRHPHSIEGHHAAATALREEADHILSLVLSPTNASPHDDKHRTSTLSVSSGPRRYR